MEEQKITNGLEYLSGARDGEKITYRISDLVITSDDPLIAGKTSELEKGVRVKVEHTMMGPFSLNYLH
ncbi:hypothetical protein HN747_02015 [archaeon]|jgi:hypothetical protein|nr:hypothetical protein [archaeon]